MRDLDRALADIGAIRQQIARQDGSHSYGPAAVAVTGVLALAVATGQWAGHAPDPATYFATWIVTAAACVLIVGTEAATRSRRLRSRLADTVILAAATDFLPAGVAGVALALVLARTEPGSLWMLPGLWQILLALGFFAASRSLPRAVALVGGWYLAAGTVTLALTSADHAPSPWAMGLPFAVGQLFAAALLRRSLKVPDEH